MSANAFPDAGPAAAVHRLFNNRPVRRVLLVLRFPLGLGFLALLMTRIKPQFFSAGLAVSAAGEFIQLWCFAALKKKKILATRGPYLLARNPMYIGRYFLILGGILLTGNPWYVVGFSVLYYFYMVNRVRREEAVLVEVFGEPYRRYCDEVNRFMPSFRNVDWKLLLFFRWKLFFKNHAHWNLLGAVLCYTAFYYYTFLR